jgi:hypothetical protein
VLRRRPNNLYQFAAEYFANKTPLQAGLATRNTVATNAVPMYIVVNDDEDACEPELRPKTTRQNRSGRRHSISAERYDPEEDVDDDCKVNAIILCSIFTNSYSISPPQIDREGTVPEEQSRRMHAQVSSTKTFRSAPSAVDKGGMTECSGNNCKNTKTPPLQTSSPSAPRLETCFAPRSSSLKLPYGFPSFSHT